MAEYGTREDASYVLRVLTYLEIRVLLAERAMRSMLMRGLEKGDQSLRLGSWLYMMKVKARLEFKRKG